MQHTTNFYNDFAPYETLIPKGYHFPFFMILSFIKA